MSIIAHGSLKLPCRPTFLTGLTWTHCESESTWVESDSKSMRPESESTALESESTEVESESESTRVESESGLESGLGLTHWVRVRVRTRSNTALDIWLLTKWAYQQSMEWLTVSVAWVSELLCGRFPVRTPLTLYFISFFHHSNTTPHSYPSRSLGYVSLFFHIQFLYLSNKIQSSIPVVYPWLPHHLCLHMVANKFNFSLSLNKHIPLPPSLPPSLPPPGDRINSKFMFSLVARGLLYWMFL